MEFVILIGLQASGKSTFARSRLGASHVYVSKDAIPNARNKERQQRQLLEEALGQGHSVVVDNTNATVAVRAALIEIGRGCGAEVVGYFFGAGLQTCLELNRVREGKARVPDVALYVTNARLERPSYAEGFDRLYCVHLGGDGFETRAWREDDPSDSE